MSDAFLCIIEEWSRCIAGLLEVAIINLSKLKALSIDRVQSFRSRWRRSIFINVFEVGSIFTNNLIGSKTEKLQIRLIVIGMIHCRDFVAAAYLHRPPIWRRWGATPLLGKPWKGIGQKGGHWQGESERMFKLWFKWMLYTLVTNFVHLTGCDGMECMIWECRSYSICPLLK